MVGIKENVRINSGIFSPQHSPSKLDSAFGLTKKFLVFVATALLLASCTKDSAYDDLTDNQGIDLTMQVAKGLTLPFGSTAPIYLTELMDTASVSQLQADADGRYYLDMQGTLSPSTFFVETTPVSFFPDIEACSFSLMVEQSSLPEHVKQVLPDLQVGDDLSRFSSVTLTLWRDDISFTGHASFDLHRDDIDPALLSVSKVWPQQPVAVEMNVRLSHLPIQSKNLGISNFRIIMPEYVELQGETAPGVYQMNNITLSDVTTDHIECSETFLATAFDFARDPQGPLLIDHGIADRPGEMDIRGDVFISELACRGADLCVQLDEQGNKIVAMKQPVEVVLEPVVQVPDVMLSCVTGRFRPDIADVHTRINLDLGDKMSFLKEPTASIELSDPRLVLDMDGNSSVALLSDLTLAASNGKMVSFNHVLLTDGNTPQHVVLDAGAVADGGDLHTFLSPLPDSVTVTTHTFADDTSDYTFQLGDSIRMRGAYQVIVPFDFTRLSLIYEQRITDLWDVEFTDRVPAIEGAELSLTVINALPIDLHLAVAATSQLTGLEEPGLVECEVPQVIPAGSIERPTSTTLTATLNVPVTSNVYDIILRFSGQGHDCGFNARQYIQIENATISLPLGLNVDFN